MISSTGNSFADPSLSGTFFGGNHRSHCAASPAAQTYRSEGSVRCRSRRVRFTLSRNQRIDPVHPTRSAGTVASIVGASTSSSQTRTSNGVNDVDADVRSYRRGASEATTLTTVVREIPTSPRSSPSAHLRSKPPDKHPVLQSDHSSIVERSHFERRYCPCGVHIKC